MHFTAVVWFPCIPLRNARYIILCSGIDYEYILCAALQILDNNYSLALFCIQVNLHIWCTVLQTLIAISHFLLIFSCVRASKSYTLYICSTSLQGSIIYKAKCMAGYRGIRSSYSYAIHIYFLQRINGALYCRVGWSGSVAAEPGHASQ